MNASYRKARKGEVTCEQCRYSRERQSSGRIECQAWLPPYYVVGRKNTCKFAEQRGDA